ncbi:hypothetical protein [Paludisphaera mucosa]|uniref:Uncharacterized protein n=1 Tax=Paludisphaera mucosa TaxID=3030827 RepID=A0ABT6FCR9_9BACT|nr:hypothetical protein [Paludisphaera mucosa]MDG3005388.1 hypothetical protein [Paludisphaera mucosa]
MGADEREQINACVADARRIADSGGCVFLVSASRRTGGSGYGRPGLASSRGSSEMEFGCDDLFTVDCDEAADLEEAPEGTPPTPRRVILDHEKN